MHIRGERNGDYPDGIPCDTGILNHTGVIDFGGGLGSSATFGGSNSQEGEENMMGSCDEVSPNINFKASVYFTKNCYQGPLNGQISGGRLTWVGGEDEWEPWDVCIDWESNNFAWLCSLKKAGVNTWNFTICQPLYFSHDLYYERCPKYYNAPPYATP